MRNDLCDVVYTEKKNKENLKCDQAAIYYQQLKVHAMRTLFIIYTKLRTR